MKHDALHRRSIRRSSFEVDASGGSDKSHCYYHDNPDLSRAHSFYTSPSFHHIDSLNDLVNPQKVANEAKYFLDLEHRCGIPNWVAYNAWVWFLILHMIFILSIDWVEYTFEMNLFGFAGTERGVLSQYCTTYMTVGVLLLYIYEHHDASEKTFALICMFKL